ncbi:MurR/RpiR family transcriptional regulator [Mesorhizobium kowhaii]|uniref:MurR/RpiR family transcriptional regulator n=1 Tax=Mesorhizobium kowhaii TaxID=1300272 RepID=UPI0035E70DA7
MDLRVARAVKDNYELFPRQMKVAARWLLDNPTEVALLSMREQARRARVPPATLTRLAKRLGFDGFDKLKEIFADSIRERPKSFAGHMEELVARQEGDGVLVGAMIKTLRDHLSEFAQPSAIAALAAAADLMVESQYIFCIGFRSGFPAAYLMHYVGSLLGVPTVLIDGIGGTADPALRSVGPGDVLLTVSVSPYTRYTTQVCEFAVSCGAKLIALTDSELSPIAKFSEIVIRVRTELPSFFHTMTPVFAAVECLVALIAAKRGSLTLEALAANEAHIEAFDTYGLQARASAHCD